MCLLCRAQLLFYPRYHLDNSSLLARYPLEQARLLSAVVLRSECSPQAKTSLTHWLSSVSLVRTHEQVPLAMDALGQHIVLAMAPLEISLMRVALHGSVTAAGNPIAHLTVVRELSILSIGTPLRVRTQH